MRERERCRAECVQNRVTRGRGTLIFKLVNPLESLEDRIAIHTVYE